MWIGKHLTYNAILDFFVHIISSCPLYCENGIESRYSPFPYPDQLPFGTQLVTTRCSWLRLQRSCMAPVFIPCRVWSGWISRKKATSFSSTGWDGYLLSEYEGADKYDPGYEVGQTLRKQHIMLKNLLGD